MLKETKAYKLEKKVFKYIEIAEEEKEYTIQQISQIKKIKQFEVKRLLTMIYPQLKLSRKFPLVLIEFLIDQDRADNEAIKILPHNDKKLCEYLIENGYTKKQKLQIIKLGDRFSIEEFPPTMHFKLMHWQRTRNTIYSNESIVISNYLQKGYIKYLKQKNIKLRRDKIKKSNINPSFKVGS